MEEKKAQEMKLEIQLDEETAQGVYANLAVVNHTDSEFVLDFVFVQPQVPRAKVRTRVITSPRHLKRLMVAIQENIRKYEDSHGPIGEGPKEAAAEFGNYH
ncbi:MAG: DUF3467 domain-containing protein [Desulfuromonadales bacterium]|jgi:hypothetical protein